MNKTRLKFTEPLNILLVDDNAVDIKMLQRMLAQDPSNIAKAKTAENFKEADKILKKDDIDVVVLDLNLTDTKGVETLVKLHQKFPEAAIVVNTGAYEEDLGLKTLSMGAQDFIVKGKYTSYGLTKAINYAKERKRFEMELQLANTRLHEAQSQLIQAEKMTSIGRLASGVAHEVKNPLATILFGIAYLNEKVSASDEKIKLTLSSITESAKRADAIIKDLLDFSSVSKLDLKPESVNIVIDKALGLTKHSLNSNCIKVKKEMAKSLPEVNLDKNRIEQVVVNLILNAVQSMTSGGQLTVKTSKRTISADDKKFEGVFTPGTVTIVVEIEDNGTGIPISKLDKIFDPFFTTKRGSGGVGLGLSVAKNIVEMHDGKLFIENKSDLGVRASVMFKV